MPSNARERLNCGPGAALRAATKMGRVMLATTAHGATHERIGPIEAVSLDGAIARLSGAAHDATLDIRGIDAVVTDRTGRMKDKVLPRLEFLDAAGETIFSIVCLDGLEPFDAATAPLESGDVLPEKEKAAANPATLGDNDPGAAPIAAAATSAQPVTVTLRRSEIEQRWSGVVETMKPAMGFINIITPDFHLHLRGGAVARWVETTEKGEPALSAENAEGIAIGLHLSGPAIASARR